VCQFLFQAGNRQFFCCGGKVLLQTGKKVLVVCLGGARSLLRPENKKVLVVCLAGVRSLLQPETKSSSRLSDGCAIVITTGKKNLVVCLACLSGGLCCCVSFWFWREIGFGFS
jgi:hypothetical protein